MNNKDNRPKILEHPGVLIMAVILAVVCWILINSVNDPISYMTITNVQVKLLNTSMITDQGNVYTILDDTDVVPVVTVKARRSVIEDLDKDDIYATADISDMTSLNTVEIQYYSSKYDSEIEDIDGSIENVLLSIETKQTKIFVLQVASSGEPADGYELDSVSAEQNQVRVSGPESVVSSIASAMATVDVSGATSSISTYVDVKLYDADGNAIDTSDLTLNITTVKVTATILPLKTVPVTVEVGGTPADGYVTNGVVTVDPDTVRLAGRSALLTQIDSVVIPAEAVNIDGCTSSLQLTVNIEDYLPDGVTLSDSGTGTISITVGIEEAETQSLSMNVSDITLDNIPDGYKAQIVSVSDGTRTLTTSSARTLSVTLTGLSSAIDAVTMSALSPSVDVGEAVGSSNTARDYTGTYTATVSLAVPEGLTMENVLTVTFETAKEDESYPSESEEEESGTDEEE